MKGFSQFLTLILIFIIVVSLVSVLSLYLTGYFNFVTSSFSSNVGEVISSCMKIESAKNNKIYLKNCGSGVIKKDKLNILIDDESFNFFMNKNSVGESEIAEITINGTWRLGPGNHEMAIISSGGKVERFLNVVPPDSAVLDLEFDEGSGNIAYDSSGNGNNGNLINNPVWVDGKFGKALQFDGTNNKYVSLPNTVTRFGSGNYTFTLWFYQFPNSGTRELFAQRELVADSVVNLTDSYHYQNGAIYFNVYSIGSSNHQTVYSSVSVPDGVWHFVAMGRNGSSMFMYVDGVNVTKGSDININTVPNFTVPFYIGKSSSYHADGMNGTIDSIKVFNKALTPDETISFTLGELT